MQTYRALASLIHCLLCTGEVTTSRCLTIDFYSCPNDIIELLCHAHHHHFSRAALVVAQDEYSVNELQILKGGDVMPEDDRSSRSVRMCYVIIVVIFLLNNDTIPLASLRYRYTISNS